MKSKLVYFFTLCLLSFSAFSVSAFAADSEHNSAKHQTVKGNWEIHHIAFPSTFIQPSVAKAVGVNRRNTNGLINVSILDTKQTPKKPLKLKLSGYAQNLVGQRKELTFKEVDEGDAVYYLAELAYSNQETFKIYVTLTDTNTGRVENIMFMQKMWVD
ncbi:DUF4426 domain-containing protein [Catenovulum sp. 2E275]|uniref:DUF4426 domain-containing protein n=1 Tax=Catenovulum sp. 2E275 TaxID=2980497 RepID=UPI0021CF1D71|nr:DUF4426 domain-containing protein [Catenovulum sp. 2E275]MCU4674509.1 DUF4426 domain-containing protein [Catenovulum sp. 2E275]